MKIVQLRGEPPPDDAFVVIRGGILEERTDEDLADKAQENFDDHGFWGLSVLVAMPADVGRICETDPRVRRYGRMNLSTVGRLREAGFPLLDTGDAPHFDVVLADISTNTLDRFRSCFGRAQERPPTRLP